jgi:hypothetical protein
MESNNRNPNTNEENATTEKTTPTMMMMMMMTDDEALLLERLDTDITLSEERELMGRLDHAIGGNETRASK